MKRRKYMSEFPSIHQDDLTLVQNKSGIRVLKINEFSVAQRLTGEILDNIVQRKTNEKYQD
jgi:hypothetical protein